MVNNILKIAVVGAESTGKSTLSEALARHFNTVWVPEYARSYIDTLGRPYKADDIINIALGQWEAEEKLIKQANKILICDTTALVEKVWIENAFGFCPDIIQSSIKSRYYNHYLLTNIDLPWQPDPQREHPHMREHFHNIYKNHLINYCLPFTEISGLGQARLSAAITAIEAVIGFNI